MPDYYDAWSANKKKKSLGTNASSSRLRRQQQYQQQPSTPTTTTITTTSISAPATVAATVSSSTIDTPTSPGAQSSLILDQPALPIISFSPALPRHPTATTTTISFKAGPSGTTGFRSKTHVASIPTATGPTKTPLQRPVSAWRFSRTIFESSFRPSSHDEPSSYINDFDDVDEDDDEDDNDDDDDEGGEAGDGSSNNVSSYLSHVSVIPRIQGQTTSGTDTPATPNFRNPLKWPGITTSTSRPIPGSQTQQPKQEEQSLAIEQLNSTPDERPGTVYSPYTSLARSSPALTGDALLAPADHPQSITTFSTRLYPQPILQHLPQLTDQQSQTLLSLSNTVAAGRKQQQQGRRPRPWSQVIWESPLLGEGLQSNQYQPQVQQSQHRVREHSLTVGTRPDTAYPALRKDMFTPASAATEKDKERAVNKSVRINIDGDVTSTTTYPRIPTQTGDSSTGFTPKRELSHGRRPMNRISLGSAFYASIEPISLSAATPSTPKTRRHLVRLPARPQSVLIPSTTHHIPGPGLGSSSGAWAQLNSTRLDTGLQPISTEQVKRRRHKSQQLEMKGASPLAVPTPWQQLAPMGTQDNAKTFHGIGSILAAPIPILKKGASQEDTFGVTALSPLDEVPEPAQLPSQMPRKHGLFTKPNAPYMRDQQRSSKSQGHGPSQLNPSPPTSAPTSFSFSSSSQQQRSSSHAPSWFLPALLESSFLFRKSLPSSTTSTLSSSSPKRATFGLQESGSTSSPTRILGNNNNTSSYSPDRTLASSSHMHHSRQQQHSYRHSSFQTRRSLPVTEVCPSGSYHYHHDLSSINTSNSTGSSNQGDNVLKKSRRKLTASLTPTSFFSSISISNSNNNSNNVTNTANNNRDHQHQQQHKSVPVNTSTTTTTTRTSLWKRDSSSVLFPFSLVSYESGGLLGEIKNTSTTICTNAPSPVVAPGTPLPPGVIVSTGVPPLKDPSLSSSSSSSASSPNMGPVVVPTISITTPPIFPRSSGSSSTLGSSRSYCGGNDHDSRSSTPTRPSRLASEIVQYREEHRDDLARHIVSQSDDGGQDGSQGSNENGGRKTGDEEENDGDDDDDDETNCSDDDHEEDEEYNEEEYEEEEMYAKGGLDSSIVIQKSHVAVYEINARWGSRLMMVLVTLGGIFCALSGGLCAEHYCKDLQLCPEDYEAHGDWCGPSGVEGAPYMLTVGLSMCTFGMYAMTHLRSPISRLVGYSEIDQFL